MDQLLAPYCTTTANNLNNMKHESTRLAASSSHHEDEACNNYKEEPRGFEDDFLQIRENYFAHKVAAVKNEIQQIELNVHQGINSEIKVLEANRLKRILLAEQIHKHKIDSDNFILSAEIQCANDECHSVVNELREKTLKALFKKKKHLEEQRELSPNQYNNYNDNSTSDSRVSTRTLRKRGGKDNSMHDSSNFDTLKKVPEIKVKLTDNEIEYDFSLMQRSSINM